MISVSSGIRRVVLLSLLLTFSWAAIAQAQQGPAENEYGNPAAIPAGAATDTGSASDSGSASATGTGSASDSGSASATGTGSASDSGSASASSSALSATVLPSTGGAKLFALGAGVLLVGSGLVARRMFR